MALTPCIIEHNEIYEQKHFSLCRWTVAGFRHSCSELKIL